MHEWHQGVQVANTVSRLLLGLSPDTANCFCYASGLQLSCSCKQQDDAKPSFACCSHKAAGEAFDCILAAATALPAAAATVIQMTAVDGRENRCGVPVNEAGTSAGVQEQQQQQQLHIS